MERARGNGGVRERGERERKRKAERGRGMEGRSDGMGMHQSQDVSGWKSRLSCHTFPNTALTD